MTLIRISRVRSSGGRRAGTCSRSPRRASSPSPRPPALDRRLTRDPRPTVASGTSRWATPTPPARVSPPFVSGTEGPGGCHRSAEQSYPALLADSGQPGLRTG